MHELILLSQVCSGSDVPSFEKGFDLDTYAEEQSKASFRFYKDDIRNLCVELGIPREFRARNGTVFNVFSNALTHLELRRITGTVFSFSQFIFKVKFQPHSRASLL